MELVAEPANARVRRSFAFVDVRGFTALAEDHGDDAAVEALHAFRSCVRSACGHYGVRVSRWLGDGAMLVGVDTPQLVCAAFEIVKTDVDGSHRLRTGAGVAVGEVLVFEGDDYIGGNVNLAARLCDEARAGELLAARSIEADLPASLEMVAREPLSIPGFRAPVDVGTVRLLSDRRAAVPPSPAGSGAAGR
jgi:class 3 adenylate cyclase